MTRLAHVRRHRTRRGPRRGHHRRVRTHVTIPTLERQVLTHLVSAAYPVEMGGGLDFDKTGRLERIHVQRGKTASIDLPPDFEVQYHTHPKAHASSPPASPEDIVSLLSDRAQQAELVVRPRTTEVIVKSPSIGALSKLPATRVFSKLDRAYTRSTHRAPPPRAARRWYDELRSLGLHVTTHPNTGPLRIPHVRPVEPRRPPRSRLWD